MSHLVRIAIYALLGWLLAADARAGAPGQHTQPDGPICWIDSLDLLGLCRRCEVPLSEPVDQGTIGHLGSDDVYYLDSGPWTWQLLPEGVIYRSYLAGAKEPKMGAVWNYELDDGWKFEGIVGARVGLLRLGTTGGAFPEGWQLDVEASAFVRLDIENELNLAMSDFRVGVPLTYGKGRYQLKLALYHLSAHAGDEFLTAQPGFTPINYIRDVLVLGASYYVWDDLRAYAEAGWAFRIDGGSEPWEFQFGLDYSPARPSDFHGAPFFAVNGHLRQEVDFGGNFVAQTGWQWRGTGPGRLLRIGLEYFNGKNSYFELFDTHEERIGMGIWYDY